MSAILRIITKAAGWLTVSLAALAVLLLATLMVGPRLMGWEGVVVLTGSMEPALKVGGIAYLEPGTDPSSVKTGDIITFRSLKDPQRMISHRVIEVIDDPAGLRFRTKGDNSQLPDQQLVPAENLVGTIRFDLPYLGYAANELRHRERYYLAVGAPAALLIASELMNIMRELRRLRRRGGAQC